MRLPHHPTLTSMNGGAILRMRVWLVGRVLGACILVGIATPLSASAEQARVAVLPVAYTFVYPIGNSQIMPSWTYPSQNGYVITQGFNTSCDPSAGQGHYFNGYYFCGHTGVDLADSAYGGVVVSTAAGMVTFAGYNGSYGNMIRIEHLLPDGSVVYSQYEHLGWGTVTVWYGEIIQQGQQIGNVGATGFADGPHLHFEIKTDDTDGPGYTFGNSSLIASFYNPLWFVSTHLSSAAQTTATPAIEPTATPLSTAEPTPLAPTPALATTPTPHSSGEEAQVLQVFYRHYRTFVTVTTVALRLRTGPGLIDQPVGVVTQGTRLAYLGLQDQWVHVALPQNVQGWVDLAYVRFPVHLASLRQRATVPRPRPQPARVATAPMARVIIDGLNVRLTPSTSATILWQASLGAEVIVRSEATPWVRVTLTNGVTGWVMGSYLALPARLRPPSPPRALLPRLYVWATTLFVRDGPRLSGTILTMVGENTPLIWLSSHVSWRYVETPSGQRGWVLGAYVKTRRKIYYAPPTNA